MKIYFAGNLGTAREFAIARQIARSFASEGRVRPFRRLYSYAYERSRRVPSWMGLREEMSKATADRGPVGLEIMLDSGAYSAWTRGTTITVEEYAQFINLFPPDTFDVIVNLDVIPGSPEDKNPSPTEVEKACDEGWENWLQLTEAIKPRGIQPLHVFHQGDDIKWLKRLMDKADYFGISPRNGIPEKQRWKWLDEIMPILCDDNGYPLRKFHGFGVTSVETMKRYPWYSCDSTSWLKTGAFGAVMIPLGDVLDPKQTRRVVFTDASRRRNGARS
jgi:hypothetical protein